MSGWHKMLSANRERAVLGLTRGIVERTADAFDVDPDLLNTPSGVVDLRTGTLQPHDPDLLMTKITRGSYRPGDTHLDWEQALTALPEDVRSWFQVRVGQGITGYPTPDGIIPVLQGGGEKGRVKREHRAVAQRVDDFFSPKPARIPAAGRCGRGQ